MSGRRTSLKSCGPHECQICGKLVSTYSNLNRHMKVKHHQQPASGKKTSQCQFDDCDYHYFALNQYREHLFQNHEIAYTTKFLEFSNKESFISWLESTEQYSSTRFTVGVSRPLKEGGTKVYYYCSRSGRYKSRSVGLRKLKAQGSCKIGKRCPSGFTLTTLDGKKPKYTVEYYPTHLGHDKLLGRTQIPRLVRRQITEQLSQGLTERVILENYRSSVMQVKDLSRVHLLTLKDINNIRTSMGLPHSLPFTRSTQHTFNPDVTSIESWVKTQEANKSSILLFKPQGLEHPELQANDFVLVLMSTFQRRLTSQYAHAGVCLDCVADSKVSLSTLMLLDENEEGYPAAYCFSSTIDASVINVFLEAVREAVGTLTASYLMSDDRPLFYDAWSSVMGDVTSTRLSVWHVLKDWQTHLQGVKDVADRHLIADSLTKCLHVTDVPLFESTLCKLMEELGCKDSDNVAEFKDFFVEHYCSRVESWAFCYRDGVDTESEVRSEAIHKALQHVLTKSDHNIVKLIDLALAYVNVRLFERVVNLHKTKSLTAPAQALQGSLLELDADSSDVELQLEKMQSVECELEVLDEEIVEEEYLENVETPAGNNNQEGLIDAFNECIVMFNEINEKDLYISDELCFDMHEHLSGFKKLLAEISLAKAKSCEESISETSQEENEMDTENECNVRLLLTEHNYCN